MSTFDVKLSQTTMFKLNFNIITRIVFVLYLLLCVSARPWSDKNVDVIQAPQTPLATIDSMTGSLSKALKTASPTLTPLMSIASLSYIAYVASVMFFPSALKDVGVPLLSDFKLEPRSIRTTESTGFVDSMVTGIMKDMIGKTEAANILRNTSINAVRDGMGTLKKTTRFLNTGLGSLQRIVNRLRTALTPECLTRYMCRVGQFTSLQMPLMGPVLRSINTFDFDDYSQALIDGTTIGDCSAVFLGCPLDDD